MLRPIRRFIPRRVLLTENQSISILREALSHCYEKLDRVPILCLSYRYRYRTALTYIFQWVDGIGRTSSILTPSSCNGQRHFDAIPRYDIRLSRRTLLKSSRCLSTARKNPFCPPLQLADSFSGSGSFKTPHVQSSTSLSSF